MTAVFKPGDPVSVWDSYGRAVERLVIVARVGARKMVLSDKSEWRADGGRVYGSSACCGYRQVLHREPGDELNWLRERASDTVRAINCTHLEEADLRTILEIAERSRKAKAKAEATNA